ncbi:MAG: tandem-95 repeat protein [Chloroflexota bacterium]|nr:MAG: tandem-95 repeat protein [Chloroflexota bacterium]
MIKLSLLTRNHRHFIKIQAIILLMAIIIGVIAPAFQFKSSFAAGGDFANTDFAASGPYSYDHATGGGAYDDGTNNKATGLVESLEGSEFACGDVVTFLTAIKVSANPVHANQTAEFNYRFLGDSTGQSGAAITDIVNVSVNRGPVSNGMGPGGTDAGLIDDGGSIATLSSKTVVGTLFTPGSEVRGTVRVTDLEAGEQVIVRLDVRLSCKPGSSPTGNLQGQLDSGRVVSPVIDTINTGQQTIPFLKIGDLLGAGEPLLSISKTVTTASGSCPGTETLTVNTGDTVKYCYTVKNPGTAELYNVSISDDNGTLASNTDDFAVELSGLTSGGLLAGTTATGSALVTLSSAGTITNIATADGNNNQTGQKLVSYTNQDSATVFVMGPANSAPEAIDDSTAVEEDGSVIIPVAGNDTDPDENLVPSGVTVIEAPTHGTLVNNNDGSFTYFPNPNYSGSDSFTYQVCDAYGLCDTAIVHIAVLPANDAPVATDDSASTLEDTPLVISVADLLLNDLDADGDNLSVTAIESQPQFGNLINNGDGSYTYSPAAGFFGEDSFAYTACDPSGACVSAVVTIIVTPVNDPPQAADDAASTTEDAAVTINLLVNDTDPENNIDAGSISIVEMPANGSLIINPDGSVTYTPDANWSGSDSFIYQICDSADPALCDTAIATILVSPANDAPVANDDAATTLEDRAVVIDILPNDTDADGDPLSISSYTQPTNGSLISNADGTFTYMPNSNWHGTDVFTYTICDPSGACDDASVTIEVLPVNDPPVASDDAATTAEEAPVVISVASNDIDVDGNLVATSAAPISVPANGSLAINSDGSFTYLPNENFNGYDSFTYQICDTENECSTAQVTIYVTPVNDLPVALDDATIATEDNPLAINPADLLNNDSDVDGDNLNISAYTQPSHGTLTYENGTFTYSPDANFCGSSSFSYTISDGELSATATVAVEVVCVNDAPVAQDDDLEATEDTNQNFNSSDLLDNDSDVDGDNLTIDSFTQPVNGTLVDNGDGTFTYTPNPNFCGSDSFTYTITDGMGGTTTATAKINVICVNDAPVGQNDTYNTNQNTKLTVSAPGVLVNDSDPVEGSPVSVSSYDTKGTFGGTIVMNPDGSFTYMPAKDFAGYDTFTYTITDGQGGYATVTVTITVMAKNGRSIAVSWGDWSKSGDQLSGYFNVQNMSGSGYAVQLTSFAIQIQYKTSGGNTWTDVAANNCVFNPATPTLLQNSITIQFSGCQLGSSIPSGATMRVTAVVGIFGHKDQGQLKQLFISRLSK